MKCARPSFLSALETEENMSALPVSEHIKYSLTGFLRCIVGNSRNLAFQYTGAILTMGPVLKCLKGWPVH